MKKSILLGFSMMFVTSIVSAQTNQSEVKPEVKKVSLNAPIGAKIERQTEVKFLKVNSAVIKPAEVQKATKEEEIEKQETNQK